MKRGPFTKACITRCGNYTANDKRICTACIEAKREPRPVKPQRGKVSDKPQRAQMDMGAYREIQAQKEAAHIPPPVVYKPIKLWLGES